MNNILNAIWKRKHIFSAILRLDKNSLKMIHLNQFFDESKITLERMAVTEIYNPALNYEFSKSELQEKLHIKFSQLSEVADDKTIIKKFKTEPIELKKFWVLLNQLIHGDKLEKDKFYLFHVQVKLYNNHAFLETQTAQRTVLLSTKTYTMSAFEFGKIRDFSPRVNYVYLRDTESSQKQSEIVHKWPLNNSTMRIFWVLSMAFLAALVIYFFSR